MRFARFVGHWAIVCLLAALAIVGLVLVGAAVHGHAPISCFHSGGAVGCVWK